MRFRANIHCIWDINSTFKIVLDAGKEWFLPRKGYLGIFMYVGKMNALPYSKLCLNKSLLKMK
jgi:hypothetical protein